MDDLSDGGALVTGFLDMADAEHMTAQLHECLRHVAQLEKNACTQRLLGWLAETLAKQNDRVRRLEARCRAAEGVLERIAAGEQPV